MGDKIVYKFRKWQDSFHQRWLLNQEIYFASPAQFNDPFDCAIHLRYDLLSPEQKRKIYARVISEKHPHFNSAKVEQEVEYMMSEGLLNKEGVFYNYEKISQEMINETVGVLSLTNTKDHVLLWSHYSYNHEGYCIGYYKDKLLDYLIKQHTSFKDVPFDFDVSYAEKYPEIIPLDYKNSAEYIKTALHTKSIVWSYEQEYRIVFLGSSRKKIILPKDVIAEIILGCRMPDKDRYEVGTFVMKEYPHVSLLQAEKDKESFQLNFRKENISVPSSLIITNK
jgi:hypothetical protein